uniref:E3 ubiquitin-protein ligase hyd n=1 Tax=Culex pipiens TaxID=7175 RepID=A0A8D8G2J2_CULPI
MKNSPMYQHEAIGLTISNGVPKFGQLLNAAWDHTIICRFKLLPMSTLSHVKRGSSPVEHPTQVQPEPKASCRHRKSKKKYAALVWAGVAAAPRKPPESGGSKETLDSST